MKTLIHIKLLAVVCLLCSFTTTIALAYDKGNIDVMPVIEYIKNNKTILHNGEYPYNNDTIRVLAIGNSFTVDATIYLKQLMVNLGVNSDQVIMSRLIHGSSSFDTWIDHINNNSAISTTETPHYDILIGQAKATTVRDVLALGWDIVVIQQTSETAGDYGTFSSCQEYVELLKRYTGNENLCLFYNMPHSHSAVTGETFGYSDWVKYAEVTRRVVEEIGIDRIIPTGTAIQKARNTDLTYGGKYNNLTRDNWHLNSGTGRYVAACTWYEALFAPYFGTSVIGSTLNILKSEKPYDETFASSFVAVNDDNRLLCVQCATNAIATPYNDNTDWLDNKRDNAPNNAWSIYTYNGTIIIEELADNVEVKIYTTNGILLHTTSVAHVTTLTLPQGIYLVQVFDKMKKVII